MHCYMHLIDILNCLYRIFFIAYCCLSYLNKAQDVIQKVVLAQQKTYKYFIFNST